MKKSILLLAIFSILLSGCIEQPINAERNANIGIASMIDTNLNYQDEYELWERVFKVYLNDPLWIERDIYDAGHNLMVPIHAAFYREQESWLRDIDQHFQRFYKEYDWNNNIGLLNQLHYYYAISRYLALHITYERPLEDYHFELANQLATVMESLWLHSPSWHWQHDDFTGMKERLDYKLSLEDPKFSYDKVIIDEELFLMAIASDLDYFYDNLYKTNDILKDINAYGQKVFLEEGMFTDEGGWLFQQNVWRGHPDYAYSGYSKLESIVPNQKKVATNVYTDSSHGTRFPLQIYSVMMATDDEENRLALQEVLEALEIQFYEKIVAKQDNFYVLNNFMDGSNGVYRYNYETNKGTGYGPYSLSGILMIGWYNFLNTDRVSEIFVEMSEQFPIGLEDYSKYYLDKTNRERNPLATEPNSYYSGLYQLNLLLSRTPLLKKIEE